MNEWLKNEWMNVIYENNIENMTWTLNTNEIDILLSISIWFQFQFSSGVIAFLSLSLPLSGITLADWWSVQVTKYS